MKKLYLLSLCLLILSGCYRIQSSSGGGQDVPPEAFRTIKPADIALPEGYQIEAIATGLTFPTGAAVDEQGQVYVVESGYSYGEVFLEPKLIRINQDGSLTTIASGTKNGPWTGVQYHNGNFYVTEGGQLEGGKILRISKEGNITPLVENLPSLGDHHTNGPAIGTDGYIYFGQGTATNSGVVGPDNADYGWLYRYPEFHDIPCDDITLKGKNYTTGNPLTEAPKDMVSTGAYVPFGTATTDGQVIKGQLPCSGAIMRVPLQGGELELVAWGFRNPYGLAFSPSGKLYITENGFDVRGSRPVWGTGDYLWQVKPGTWYGWPDFAGGIPFLEDRFAPPGKDAPGQLLAKYPNEPPKPDAILGVHSSSNGIDFSSSNSFGYQGQAFIAQFGDMAPEVGKVLAPVGYKVVRVDTETGVVKDFAANNGKENGPASRKKSGGLERPISVRFSPDGNAMYIVDFGVMTMSEHGPAPQTETGVVWKVTKK